MRLGQRPHPPRCDQFWPEDLARDHVGMSGHDPVPNPLSRKDAEALLGIVIELEGAMLHGLDQALVKQLAGRLQWAGLLDRGAAGSPEARLAITNLNQRLRYALGTYDEPPEPDIGLVDHQISFRTETQASEFRNLMDQLGLRSRLDPAEQEPPHVRVTVTTEELLLSEAFNRKEGQIRQAAARAAGDYEGWDAPGTPPER
jgi:Regulator of ribonuclease activity B